MIDDPTACSKSYVIIFLLSFEFVSFGIHVSSYFLVIWESFLGVCLFLLKNGLIFTMTSGFLFV